MVQSNAAATIPIREKTSHIAESSSDGSLPRNNPASPAGVAECRAKPHENISLPGNAATIIPLKGKLGTTRDLLRMVACRLQLCANRSPQTAGVAMNRSMGVAECWANPHERIIQPRNAREVIGSGGKRKKRQLNPITYYPKGAGRLRMVNHNVHTVHRPDNHASSQAFF